MERDYPIGHPSASDYKGEKYTPPRAPFAEDFGPDHPARLGANVSALDTPDGSRDRTVQEWRDNARRTAANTPVAVAQQEQQPATDVQATTTTFSITGEVTSA